MADEFKRETQTGYQAIYWKSRYERQTSEMRRLGRRRARRKLRLFLSQEL